MTYKMPKRKPRPGMDVYGRTPLHNAVIDGKIAVCRKLLGKGADPDAQDDGGWTPLHFAAQDNSLAITKLLLGAGARVDLKDEFGNTPLGTAVFASEGDGAIIRALRAAGANPRTRNKSGVSPLRLARVIANFDLARFFADLA